MAEEMKAHTIQSIRIQQIRPAVAVVELTTSEGTSRFAVKKKHLETIAAECQKAAELLPAEE